MDALGAVVLVSDSLSLLKGPEIWKLAPDGSSLVVAGTTNSVDFPSLMPSAMGAGKTFIARLRP